MMMNREKIGFWVRLVAIVLSVFFVGSFIFMGLGTNVSYNLFELIGGSDEKERKGLYRKAGDAYAAAAEIEPENEDAYLLAGEAYDQAGEPAQAIKYYNGYLDLEPEGEQAQAVEERISALLEGGGESTNSAQP